MIPSIKELKAISIENLSKRVGDRHILNSINLTLEIGEFFGILGPAGAGKTTLLRILAGLEKADAGKIKLFGTELKGKAHMTFRKLGVWLEEDVLIDSLSLWQNLWFFSALLGISYKSRKAKISNYLMETGLWELRKRDVATLSKKERGLVNLVRVLLNEPALLILDEPESSLDSQGLNFLLKKITKLRENNNTTILWASSRSEWFEQADRVAIIKQGEIIACDTPFNLKKIIAKEFPQNNASFQTISLEKVYLSLTGEKNALP
ncbi:ABC transporter ATP-binding protein [bacterium]|nr:ABC transporter ATP-binding protein [bacterium]